MPHEVIMPALGMAQDTGQIVAWLKKPGDAVKVGDALMEVETDKATMEVEAAADGFLTDVRAEAGATSGRRRRRDHLRDRRWRGGCPAAEPELKEADGNDASAGKSPDEAAPVEGAEVIMPALGMSQDSGKIVSWLKAPGDAVGADDVLFEVETDKAVTEVQAGHDGWLAETRGEAGDDVPVGEVIAIISAEKPAAPRSLSRPRRSPAVQEPAAESSRAGPSAARRGAKASGRAVRGARHPAAPAGRVLASPKARRLAKRARPRPRAPRRGRIRAAVPCRRPRDAGGSSPNRDRSGAGSQPARAGRGRGARDRARQVLRLGGGGGHAGRRVPRGRRLRRRSVPAGDGA